MRVLLSAERLRVEFGALVAVRDVSFELAGGQLLGLVGPNGAGKTTLLRVLAGLHAPTRGIARVLDKPVLGEHEVVRHHVGFAPDSPPAYEELTTLQFLRFIARAYQLDADTTEERIDFWLENLWLSDRRDAKIKTLSRGMRQRVTLARTFLPQPHVLLLDEPLAGLDPAGRIELRRVLGMLREQGCAMIVSSHILADLEEVATHIAFLTHGSIIRWSTAEGIHQRDDRRRLYRLTALDDEERVMKVLSGVEPLTRAAKNGEGFEFEYSGDQREAAVLLKRLMDEGLSIVAFGAAKESLEDAYLRAGIKQVD